MDVHLLRAHHCKMHVAAVQDGEKPSNSTEDRGVRPGVDKLTHVGPAVDEINDSSGGRADAGGTASRYKYLAMAMRI